MSLLKHEHSPFARLVRCALSRAREAAPMVPFRVQQANESGSRRYFGAVSRIATPKRTVGNLLAYTRRSRWKVARCHQTETSSSAKKQKRAGVDRRAFVGQAALMVCNASEISPSDGRGPAVTSPRRRTSKRTTGKLCPRCGKGMVAINRGPLRYRRCVPCDVTILRGQELPPVKPSGSSMSKSPQLACEVPKGLLGPRR